VKILIVLRPKIEVLHPETACSLTTLNHGCYASTESASSCWFGPALRSSLSSEARPCDGQHKNPSGVTAMGTFLSLGPWWRLAIQPTDLELCQVHLMKKRAVYYFRDS
jgi:hypothetical protein